MCWRRIFWGCIAAGHMPEPQNPTLYHLACAPTPSYGEQTYACRIAGAVVTGGAYFLVEAALLVRCILMWLYQPKPASETL
jgi:hypothetical protein